MLLAIQFLPPFSLQSCNKIEIKGLSPKTTKDSVANYFENSRRSGGGDVEEVIISDTTAHVTFASSEGKYCLLILPNLICFRSPLVS